MFKVKNLVKSFSDFCDFMDKSQDDLSPKDRSKQKFIMFLTLLLFIVINYVTFLMLFY